MLVRDLATGNVGADTPNLVRFAGTVALFHRVRRRLAADEYDGRHRHDDVRI